jgi:hypothetical protein
MLASIQIRPPGQLNPQGIGELFIGVRIWVMPEAIAPYIAPKNNQIATMILYRLLQARMELAGMRVTSASGILEFNWSYYLFSVSELEPALEAIKAELEKLGLLAGAQIAWYDPRELVFRVWYSKSGRFDEPSSEVLNADAKLCAALRDAAKEFQQLKDEPPGQ